jgi:hypothetical protein
MDFIFMLTRHDRTVEDCLQVFDAIAEIGLTHVGFKDVGVDFPVLQALHRRIKESGATSYMEVVSTTPEAALNSAKIAAQLGVDRLMGGTDVPGVLALLRGTPTAYMPFPGRPEGHPTKLGGSPAEVEAHCRRFLEQGCAGADLLAYRATEADPLDLIRAARRGLGQKGLLIVAGSIDSPERIRLVGEAGADAFTIGSAAFDGSFSPQKGLLANQLRDILARSQKSDVRSQKSEDRSQKSELA